MLEIYNFFENFQIISVFRVQNPESRIRIRIRIKIKPWIRIRIEAYADPKPWL